jgi:hypothetical protein
MRPIFTIHAGEYLVASEIEKRFRDLRVWIPSKDTGIDLLVTDDRQNKMASLQVKFSKDYFGTANQAAAPPEIASSGWWTFRRDKIASSAADFWVLTLYQFQTRTFDFVVISPLHLLARYDKLAPKANIIQSYFCITRAGRCWETRGLGKAEMTAIRSGEYSNKTRDFSVYLNAWPFPGRRQ